MRDLSARYGRIHKNQTVICHRSCLILTRKNLFSVYFNKPVTLLFSFWLKSDDHDGSEIETIKQEITQLRNSVFQGIYHEQEEYVSI